MQKSFDISVVIPTFNREQLIQRAIQSVLNQTLPPKEIIVIDDGSTDNTGQIIKNKFPETNYIYQENAGISTARNKGIEKSTANWIAFLDSDDEWLPNKLELQVKALSENPDYKICHTNEIWIRHGRRVNQKKKHQKFGGFIFEKCLPLCVISPSSVLINREIFEKFGLYDVTLPACEDYDMWIRICAFLPVLYLEQPLIKKYGGHADQLSNKYWGMDRFRIAALEKVVKNKSVNPEYRKQALEMLNEKLNIFIKGAKNRNKQKETIKEYIEQYNYYKNMLIED